MRRLPLVAVLVAATLGLSTVPAAQAARTRVATLRTFAAYPQVGAEITVFGYVSSSPNGSTVTIQEIRSGSWVDVGTTATDDTGEYSLPIIPAFGGTRSFRTVAPATADLAKAISSTLSLGVAGRPKVPFDQAPLPTVTGTHTVGSLLSIDFGMWSPDVTRYVRWIREGTPINAYGYKYRMTAQDLGKHMTVAVFSTRSDSRTNRESRPGEVVRPGTFATRAPTITGQVAVGQTVAAEIGSWTPKPTTVDHQWFRDEVAIPGATNSEYTLVPDDARTDLTVEVRGAAAGYDPATRRSAPVAVPGVAPASDTTFGDVMKPHMAAAMAGSDVTVATRESAPQWGPNTLTRWDQPGAFAHSLDPKPMGTLYSDYYQHDIRHAAGGAEYVSSNAVYKNADIGFEFTGSRFAIEYRTHTDSDAMVWIDDQPVSASPLIGRDASTDQRGTRYWITVTLPERKAVTVRFAGPFFFTGVHTPTEDQATITANEPALTLGIIGDSFFDTCLGPRCMTRAPGPALSTHTGFRVWNMAESGTGYLRNGTGGFPGHTSSRYGSEQHIAAIKDAPIDALLVNGSANDTNWTPAEHRSALETVLDDVERVRPGLPVVLVGIEPIPFARSAYWLPHFRALTSNFGGMVGRHENVVGFIDPYTDPWLTAGNQAQYVGADGLHLTGEGQVYYQGRIADALADLPLPPGA